MKSHCKSSPATAASRGAFNHDTVAPLGSRARHHAWHLRGIWGIIVKEKLQSTASDAQKREKTQADSLLTLWQRLFFFRFVLGEKSPQHCSETEFVLSVYFIACGLYVAFFQAQDPSITATTSSFTEQPCRRRAGFLI